MSNELVAKGERVLLQQARDRFVAAFNRTPTAASCAPGRVNLIGEHIDYCEGFVLPVALPFVTVVVGALNNTGECNVISVLGSGEEVKASFLAPTPSSPLKPGSPAWANYVKGVVANFPGGVSGFDAVIVTDVPIGSGLSSSASIEVAIFTFLEGLTGNTVGLVEKAKLCQKAEHEFPGMPCGIMDQYIVTMGKKDHALLIDCRSLEAQQIPMELGELAVLVTNTNVKHQLTGSEYPTRRAQCQEAADRLGLPSLRGATVADLEKLKQQNCSEDVLKRAKHVIEEISRTEEVGRVMTEKNFQRVGELFYQSHDSLSQLMEVSCPELDQLVDIMRGAPGVYGARMTGGGFGGCVVALVKKTEVENLKKRVLSSYKGTPTFFVSQPSDGAKLLKL
ncbi:galactokinase-like [Trichoplusia ni]|uniref:Galactokinase-like n=1 Tax=Trichoplusia ni TaxID=7111 RepID=A0A7E5VAQ0_TRINI|nr:galactokinase-like [Trichoplusia ni]